jgi:hypothetical protein
MIEIQMGTAECAQGFLDILTRHEQSALEAYIFEKHEDVEFDSESEMLEFLEAEDDSLFGAMWIAYEAGYVAGTENEIIKVFRREVNDLEMRHGAYLTFDGAPRQFSLIGKVEIVVPTDKLISLVDDQENGVDEIDSILSELELDLSDRVTTYVNHEGFDADAARARFAEDYPEIIEAAKKRKEDEMQARLK